MASAIRWPTERSCLSWRRVGDCGEVNAVTVAPRVVVVNGLAPRDRFVLGERAREGLRWLAIGGGVLGA